MSGWYTGFIVYFDNANYNVSVFTHCAMSFIYEMAEELRLGCKPIVHKVYPISKDAEVVGHYEQA